MAKQSGSVAISLLFGSTSLEGDLAVESAGQNFQQLILTKGTGGFLTTRTDDDTGVATLASGHGLLTGDVVDVYWVNGCRYGMDATVDGDAVTVDGGAGDNLPGESATLVVTKRTVLVAPFAGDDLVLLALLADQTCQVVLRDSGGSVLWAQRLTADLPWFYVEGGYIDNPVVGDDVADVCVSCGSADADATFQMGALYDSDA